MAAVARSYDELRRALMVRRLQLQRSRQEVSLAAGLDPNFMARFELGRAWLSEKSLSRLCAALAVKLYVQSTDEAA
jgi:hypothetical protein